MSERPECVLCGYPAQDYVRLPVPLTRRPRANVVCGDCIEELVELRQEAKAEEPA